MFWKFFCVKKILDTLFDDSWCSLGLPEGDNSDTGFDPAFATQP